MKLRHVGLGLLVVCGLVSGAAAQPHRVQAAGGCPTVLHAPLVNVVRGQPAVITATVDCPTGTVGDVILQVRVTDLGKPTPIPMTSAGGGVYKATVPLSMLQGLVRFWYFIDARGTNADGDESTAQTRWYPVNIIQHGEAGQGGGGAGAGAGGGSGGGGGNTLLWVAGGAAVVGGAVIVENNNDDGGSGGDGGGNGGGTPADSPDGNGNGDENGDEPCVNTGFEQAFLTDREFCFGGSPFRIFVCGTCPDSTIVVTATWGDSVVLTNVQELPCPPSKVPTVLLEKPDDYFPDGPNSETISVFVNGTLIQSFSWPSVDEYQNCL